MLHHRAGRMAEAERGYVEVLRVSPDQPDALHFLGILAGTAGDHARAATLIGRSLLHKKTSDAYCHLGVAQAALGQIPAAVKSLEAALSMDPRHASAHHHLGGALSQIGRREEARKAFRAAIAAKPDLAEAYSNLGLIETWRQGDPAAQRLIELEKRIDTLPAASAIHVHYALGKYYDDIDDPDRAFAQWSAGAALKRRTLHYDADANNRELAEIAAAFPPGPWAAATGHGDPSELPVFVLGMPRSGTSLVEQILASHPQVHGAGELRLLSAVLRGFQAHPDLLNPERLQSGRFAEDLRRRGADYVRPLRALAPQARRITDKLPNNFRFAGPIHLILPRARIVLCKRDLRDVCLSCFQTLFMTGNAWSYDLRELGRYAAAFARLMEHWDRAMPGRILEVTYETLVSEPDAEARRLIAHCGLDWDERCLQFHKSERAVRTASLGQVREPVHRRSVGRWRRYERHLGPLIEALGD